MFMPWYYSHCRYMWVMSHKSWVISHDLLCFCHPKINPQSIYWLLTIVFKWEQLLIFWVELYSTLASLIAIVAMASKLKIMTHAVEEVTVVVEESIYQPQRRGGGEYQSQSCCSKFKPHLNPPATQSRCMLVGCTYSSVECREWAAATAALGSELIRPPARRPIGATLTHSRSGLLVL